MPVKTTQSSYRDRTLEFQNVAERLKKSFSNAPSSSGDGGSKAEPPRSAVSIQSEFNKRASKIGFGIHQTSQKLAKLAKFQYSDELKIKFSLLIFWQPLKLLSAAIGIVAKRTSVFDDPTVEIQELTAVIKQDITALNSAVVDLQLVCNSQNESGNISSDTTTHSTTVVDNLKNRLMSTTKEFKDVLTMRTENMKVHDNRRQLFSSTATKESTNPFVRQRPLAGKSAASASASPPPWANDSASSSQLFPRIDENMEDTLANVEGAQGQLVSYESHPYSSLET
ncbi:hypothetical protein RJ640_024251 [Escallonia rubra]|uniref:Syntaxin-5 N-terminal Sly1p-binding domain-containing protein n=1 Tax=Escallonia rubra TaxID=112253 RepID=A0AA88R307_9ASTE|nr:hypothetical protein RJ640_024251 [Escallonia rubra]